MPATTDRIDREVLFAGELAHWRAFAAKHAGDAYLTEHAERKIAAIRSRLVHTADIAGRTFHLYRTDEPDLPSADVWVRRDDGTEWVVNTQYAFALSLPLQADGRLTRGAVNPRAFGIYGDPAHDADPAILAVAHEIADAAQEYHRLHRAAEDAADAERQRRDDGNVRAAVDRPLPADIAELFRVYGSADGAWEAEDEEAWAEMRPYDLGDPGDCGLPEDC